MNRYILLYVMLFLVIIPHITAQKTVSYLEYNSNYETPTNAQEYVNKLNTPKLIYKNNHTYELDSIVARTQHQPKGVFHQKFETRINEEDNEEYIIYSSGSSDWYIDWGHTKKVLSFYDLYRYNENDLLEWRSRHFVTLGETPSLTDENPSQWTHYLYNDDHLIEEIQIHDTLTISQNENYVRQKERFEYDSLQRLSNHEIFTWDFRKDSLTKFREFKWYYYPNGPLQSEVEWRWDDVHGIFPQDSLAYYYNIETKIDSIQRYFHGRNVQYDLNRLFLFEYHRNQLLDQVIDMDLENGIPFGIHLHKEYQYTGDSLSSSGFEHFVPTNNIIGFEPDGTPIYEKNIQDYREFFFDGRILKNNILFSRSSQDFLINDNILENQMRTSEKVWDDNNDRFDIELELQYDYYYSKIDRTSVLTTVLDMNKIIITPNPSSNHFIIQSDIKGSYHLNLFDISGYHVLTKRINSAEEQVNVSNLKQGIYTYQVKIDNNVVHVGKLFIL